MVRVKRGPVARIRRRKFLKFSKGFKGAHSRLFRIANGKLLKSFIYSNIGRRKRKQDFRKLWIGRVNASSLGEGLTYGNLKSGFKKHSVELNLKMLAQLSLLDKQVFNYIVREIS
jgi:large subunit ribosomal protein L20